MSYAVGAIAGILLGGVAGQLKNFLIWKKYLNKGASENTGQNDSMASLYSRAFVSYSVNILVLAIAFFARNLFPFNGIAFLIGTAIGLSIMNKALALGQKKRVEGE